MLFIILFPLFNVISVYDCPCTLYVVRYMRFPTLPVPVIVLFISVQLFAHASTNVLLPLLFVVLKFEFSTVT